MAQLDDGVVNIERFIGVLAETSGRLDEAVEALAREADGLDRLDGDAEDTLGGFTETLENVAAEIGEAADALAEGYDRLGQEASAIAQERSGEAEGQVESAGSAFTQEAGQAGETLDGETANTVNDGFKRFGETLDHCTADVRQAGEAGENGLETLRAQADSLMQEADGAFDATETRLDADRSDLGALGTTVEAAASAATSALEAAGTELGAACDGLRNDVDATYDTVESAIQTDFEELATGTQSEATEVSEAIGQDATEPVADGFAEFANEASDAYDVSLDGQAVLVEAAVEMANDLDPLVAQLDRAQNVVGEIDRLLNAME